MATKVLLVDDNVGVLEAVKGSLEQDGFFVVTASSVVGALSLITTQQFDALVTDLHMPNAGDGFTLVTAMRHTQPSALTLVASGFPDTKEAMSAILLQADRVIAKPFSVKELGRIIEDNLTKERSARTIKETVATVLGRDIGRTIKQWEARVAKLHVSININVAIGNRAGHLYEMLDDIVIRLRASKGIDVPESISNAAIAHGKIRFEQGYTASLIVQESRILQVCIFETLQRNLGRIDFSLVLPDIMVIADEVDSQLAQTIDSFLAAQQLAA